MTEVELVYDRLRTDDLRGTTQADYLVAFDAHIRLLEGDEVIYDEAGFPVVELARSLRIWLGDPGESDFEFDSMSYEEPGAIAIRNTPAGWVFGSVFAPSVWTNPAEWRAVDECCRHFIARVEADLDGLGLDPGDVLR
ncbi:hypothetical protein FLP10_12835 [Agromyces intestinalis]|uniref:DUF7878 domain-containing protein n=1 Tax=Agromyces intestinalis TaxID=2592652 RepID=A0A5C1YJE5_9MICO|nr:hypothetical protein [Agromyces intestinalis]QEO15207.1 hypothetical protein FLP10_12835 [Agromyces intestinalis]